MDSASSSPGQQTAQQTHAELLQAFQSYKPGRRGASKTPQLPFSSRTQRSSTPATSASRATKGMTATQEGSPSIAASTQGTTTRKRARRIPMEQTEEQESSDSDTPLSQTLKRPRQSSPKVSDQPTDISTTQQASTIPKHVVEVRIQNGLAPLEKVAFRALQSIESIQGEQGRASMTPEVTAVSIEGIRGQQMNRGAFQYPNTANPFASQTVQSSKAFATQLLNENQKFTESLSQKNGAFLRTFPPTAKSYLEAKLTQITADLTQLHQEKVDAIRLECVVELQRDMDERQKVIDMFLHKSDT
ncbi:hypothetical protein TMatcc_008031 [Talaromyces marneffei ATCC 18224]|uniref:uncharacterized protein n=1 Tax=Talaromyces marneffei TaxID=37727 RepID=UPI0012A867D3|nr:uncharacterized protein EYB26_004934 [Talaromyces marneffei]KAE8552599.1 hypothetical protein EYB25_003978 [Talaromyces marneffei]QGA17264.1 hypothetical protein EYB26_004934 [Talaromyces marneffei]